MSITEIETAIRKLPASEVGELTEWLDAYNNQLADKQTIQDLDAVRFDSLIAESYASGEPTPLTTGDIDEARRIVRDRIAARTELK